MSMVNTSVTTVPAARFDGLITTASDDELVVYDEAAKHIHHLNQVSSAIWRLCDGRRGVSEIAVATSDALGVGVGEDTVRLALRKLDDANLLDGSLSAEVRGTAQSRRSFLKKAAVAASVPTVVSLTAPIAASASSTCGGTELSNKGCNTGNQGAYCWTGGKVGAGICGTCVCTSGTCNCDGR